MRLAALLALIATCGPTAPAIADGDVDVKSPSAPKPELVCRERRTPDVPAPACTGSRGVVQPCAGVLVPAADLLAVERRIADLVEAAGRLEVDLTECRRLRDSDATGCADREAVTVAERDAARALAAAHAAEVVALQEDADAGPSWWTVAGVGVVAVVVGVVVGGL